MLRKDKQKNISVLRTFLGAIMCSIAFTAWNVLAAPGDLDPAKRVSESVSSITVTNTNDSGAGSLRQAIASAAPGDTISFSVTGSITLTSGRLVIDKNLTIRGPGADRLSISGNNTSTVFHITFGGINATFDGITIRNGLDDGIINRGTLTVSKSIITQNGGSGINGNGSITVINSTISGNAHSGINADAGCYFPPYLSVSNSTISGNGWTGINNFDGIADIANSTIVGNRGGIFSAEDCWDGGGTTRLWNTIVAGNAPSPQHPYGSGTDILGRGIAAAGHNLIGDAAFSAGITNGVNGNIVGVDPLLGALRINGGPIPTHALRRTSPAVNGGDNCVLTVNGCRDGIPALTTDQRGVPRNGTVDIGAFERQVNEPSFAAPFDYDGDGKTDFSVYRPSNGTWYVARSQTNDMYVRPWTPPNVGSWIVPADYDGDGKTDIAISFEDPYQPTIFLEILYSSTHPNYSWLPPQEYGMWRPADFDGNGKAQPAVWTADGSWKIQTEGGSIYTQQWGIPGDKPVPADFDGDGRAELVVWRPSEGRWYILNLAAGTIGQITWGVEGDIPVVGDYSGDGKADYAVYRPSNNTWYRLHSSDYSMHIQTWGEPNDVVTPGDYDGDGRMDAAVFRPSEGTWYVLTAAQTILTSTFGQAGDVPTPSAFIH